MMGLHGGKYLHPLDADLFAMRLLTILTEILSFVSPVNVMNDRFGSGHVTILAGKWGKK